MSNTRYHSISLEPDDRPGTYRLAFSTMPGMSTSITDLRNGANPPTGAGTHPRRPQRRCQRRDDYFPAAPVAPGGVS